jgi:hypothetical protein
MLTSRALALLLVLTLLVAACGSDDPVVDEGSTTADPAATAVDPAVPPSDAEPADPSTAAQATAEGAAPAVEDAPPGQRVEQLAPEPGGQPVVLDGAVAVGSVDVFLVQVPTCCAGETLYARVASDDGAVVDIFDPQGEAFATDQTDVTVEPDETGEWQVIVRPSADDAAYSLEVGIAVSAS